MKNNIVKKVLDDLKKNPHKKAQYREILLKSGLLQGKVVTLSRVNTKEIEKLLENKNLIIIK